MTTRRHTAIAATMAAIVLTAAIVPPCRGDDSAQSAELEAEVRRLLVDLAAPTRAVRNAAANRLLGLGPEVLPFLPPPELLATVSVREAVGRLRIELERRQAQLSTQASRATLVGTRPLKEWLAEITRQTGNRLDGARLPAELQDRALTLNEHSREFWPLVDLLATRGGTTIEASGPGRGLELNSPADEAGRPTATVGYAGPFRLSAAPVQVVPVGDSRDPAVAALRKNLARVQLSVQPEPRLRPLFLQYATADIGGLAKDSVSLRPFSPEASYDLPIGESGGKSIVQLDYVLPAGDPPRAIDLRGKLRMTIAAGSAAIRFDNVAKRADGKPIGIDRRRGGVTVTLQRARRDAERGGTSELRIQTAVTYDSGGPAFESHRTWMLHNEVFLETKDGARLTVNGGFETTLEADGAVGMEYRFLGLPDPLPDYTFVYVAPTLIVDVPVEFVLESIPVKSAGPRR